jgi:hypothetical protein
MVIGSHLPQGVLAVGVTLLGALVATFLFATLLPSTMDLQSDAAASVRKTSLEIAWLRVRAITEQRSSAAP